MGKQKKKSYYKSQENINKTLSDAWLNIRVDEDKLFNPLDKIPPYIEDQPHLYILWLMRQPEYFSFICKEVMNIQLLPFQAVILKELWNRKFPMLIGSRGMSKSFLLALYAMLRMILIPGRKIVICGAAFRQSKVIFNYMENIWYSSPLLRDMVGTNNNGPYHSPDMYNFRMGEGYTNALPLGDGQKIRGQRAHDILCDEFACLECNTLIQTDKGLIKIKDYLDGEVYDLLNMNNVFETPTYIFKTPKTDVYEITVQNDYSFKCSNIHKVLTIDSWKLAKDLTTNDFLELDINDYFPSNYIKYDELVVDEKIGWLLGLLVSEGTVTNRNYIQISNTDKELIDNIQSKFSEYNFKLHHKPSYTDGSGWLCKESYNLIYSNTEFRTRLYKLGLDYVTSHNKSIPSCILKSPKYVIIEFLRGLFTGDGSCFTYENNGKKRIGVSYYSTSEELINELQILLLKFGIICSKNNRKSKISNSKQWLLVVRGSHCKSLVELLDIKKWNEKIKDGDFFKHKPYIRENGKKFVVSTCIANKSKHLGTFDTKQECLEAFEQYQKTARPVFRIKSVKKLDEQQVLYDFYLPETHSFYGNGFVHHNSIPLEIFENVIVGFGSVTSTPVENVMEKSKETMSKKLGIKYDDKIDDDYKPNQIAVSGTAYYDFNHFATYWKRWREIIRSRGDKRRIQEIFGRDEIPEDFDWRDYSVIRIPFELLPKGFMDEAMVARSKATVHSGIYEMEFSAIFSTDSNGFFKRSLIETCVLRHDNEIELPSGKVFFKPMLKGDLKQKYIYGIDPASEADNFSIVILENRVDHSRIVHCWTTTRKEHREKIKLGLVKETDFYSYCARKIRDLMKVFPCERIALDSQGGGIAIIEALHDGDKVEEGEHLIWPIIDPEKRQDTDGEPGLHIVEMINFVSSDWVSEANHGLRKDFEDKVCIFPFFDSITLGLASIQDEQENKIFDTYEDCIMEIEELKNELSTIVITQTQNGRDRWDTPEIKLPGNKKGRLRKDRYSALVMANMAARQLRRNPAIVYETAIGGFARSAKNDGGKDYIGPSWFTEGMRGVYD